MLSNVIGLIPVQTEKESMMKQLCFEFAREQAEAELSRAIEEDLIEQMAVLLIQVNKGEIIENDDSTDQ